MFRSLTTFATNSFIPTMVATDEPGDVDVAAYLGDSDTPFTALTESRQTQVGNGGVVTIEHNLFTSAGVNSADVVKRGVVVAAAVYMLERAGTRCRVVGRMHCHQTFKPTIKYDYRIEFKTAAEPLNLGRLLYWLAHPSVLRILLHQIGRLHGAGSGDGYSFEPTPEDPNAIQTPGHVIGTALQEWLTETLTRCGLKVR
jgi:hypothetical protein